jgi:hypothetical protein
MQADHDRGSVLPKGARQGEQPQFPLPLRLILEAIARASADSDGHLSYHILLAQTRRANRTGVEPTMSRIDDHPH